MATNFYRKPNPKTGGADFYEVGTDRYIGPDEFKKGGFVEQKDTVTPRVEAPTPLSTYKSNQKFLDIVKEAVKRKQGYNRDIQSQKNYWRTIENDPMTLTDERLQLLTPSEQQALREKRYSTARAHLTGLGEEETIRETRVEDIIDSLTRAQEAEMKDRERMTDAESRLLDLAKKREDLGYTASIEDVYGSYTSEDSQRVGNKQGGTAAWRNNNPGNIKYSYGDGRLSGMAQSLLDAGIAIKQGSKATDGGYFIAFPTEEEGDNAMKKLLKSESYANLSIDEAMSRWSGGGYNASVMKNPVSKRVKDLTDEEFEDLIAGMKKREGWKEGTLLKVDETNKHEIWKEADVKALAEKTKMNYSDLWNNYSDRELSNLAETSGESVVQSLSEKIDEKTMLKYGIKKRDDLEYLLTLYYELDATEEEIKAALEAEGITLKLKELVTEDEKGKTTTQTGSIIDTIKALTK